MLITLVVSAWRVALGKASQCVDCHEQTNRGTNTKRETSDDDVRPLRQQWYAP